MLLNARWIKVKKRTGIARKKDPQFLSGQQKTPSALLIIDGTNIVPCAFMENSLDSQDLTIRQPWTLLLLLGFIHEL